MEVSEGRILKEGREERRKDMERRKEGRIWKEVKEGF